MRSEGRREGAGSIPVPILHRSLLHDVPVHMSPLATD